MTAGYRLTETAEAELGEILLYVADRDGVERALHVHDRFVRAFELLAAQRGIRNNASHPHWRYMFGGGSSSSGS